MIVINWTNIVSRHWDFIKGGTHPHDTYSVCLKDGCGEANFHGPDAWFSAARHLGFKVNVKDECCGKAQ